MILLVPSRTLSAASSTLLSISSTFSCCVYNNIQIYKNTKIKFKIQITFTICNRQYRTHLHQGSKFVNNPIQIFQILKKGCFCTSWNLLNWFNISEYTGSRSQWAKRFKVCDKKLFTVMIRSHWLSFGLRSVEKESVTIDVNGQCSTHSF